MAKKRRNGHIHRSEGESVVATQRRIREKGFRYTI